MKPRILTKTINLAMRTFPAIVVTGPRQSGKTTLLRHLFGNSHRFVSLEDPDVRTRAHTDPRAFLDENRPPVILDEIQYVPELLSYIKTKIDADRKPGQWLFTGSQNFVLMRSLSESLAGRVAVLSLLPFSVAERADRGEISLSVAEWLKVLPETPHSRQTQTVALSEVLLRGNYPEIASSGDVDRQLWCGSYISTYLERDVRNLAQVGDLIQFERFLRACAVRTGQLLNLTDMARELGISVPTVRRWLSILEASYQVYLLYPYYRNIGKRLLKSPKLYFSDMGLTTYLMGLNSSETLLGSPSLGNIFETLVVTDIWKRFLHFGELPSIYYIRTRDGLEIDLALEVDGSLHLFEIKSAMTLTTKHAQAFARVTRDKRLPIETTAVISRSPDNFSLRQGVMNYSWNNVLLL